MGRQVLKLLIFISVLLLLMGKSASAENHFRVESLPRVVKQGEVCLISIVGPPSLKSIYVEFQGVRFPLAFSEQNGTYEGLIGIDMKTLEGVDKEEKKLNSLFRVFRDEKLWRGAFIRPVEGDLSVSFGLGRIINGQRRSPHTGVDLRAEEGAPILACNNGIVVLVEELFFSGKSVILDHGKTKGTLMKIITLHPLVIVVEGFYASASKIRRTWDTSPCDGTGNGRLPDIFI